MTGLPTPNFFDDPEIRAVLAEFPPLSPTGETAADDSELKHGALGVVATMSGHVLKAAVTRNENFGTIVRIDYYTSSPDLPLRLIGWRGPDGPHTLVCCVDDAEAAPA